MSALGDRIREEREYMGYPPARLAEALGIDEQDYMAFEIGAEEPSPDQLARIARLCGTTVDRLHGAPMPTSPWADRLAATGRLSDDDVWELHRFAEFLNNAPDETDVQR